MDKTKWIVLMLTIACTPAKKEQQTSEEMSKKTEAVTEDTVPKSSWSQVTSEVLPVEGYFPQFVPNGKALVYTSKSYQGLWMFDFTSLTSKALTDKRGAGYQPEVLSDRVVYQVKSKVKYIESVDLTSGTVSSIQEGKNKLSPSRYKNSISKDRITVQCSSDLQKIEITEQEGETRTISPSGNTNYLYAALSPDKDRIVYQVSGLGSFICDLKGQIQKSLGDAQNPSWISASELLYTVAKDDGTQILSSELYVHDTHTNEKFHLSIDIDDQVENPRANVQGDQIVANTQEGKIYLIKKTSL